MNLNEAIKTLKTAGYLVEALNWDAVFKENPAAKKTIETLESQGIKIIANKAKDENGNEVFETIVDLGEKFADIVKGLPEKIKNAKENNPSKVGIYQEFIKGLNKLVSSIQQSFQAKFLKDKHEIRLIINPKVVGVHTPYVMLAQMLTPLAFNMKILDMSDKSEEFYKQQAEKIDAFYKQQDQKIEDKYAKDLEKLKNEIEGEQKALSNSKEFKEKIDSLLKEMELDNATAYIREDKIMISIASKDFENSLRAAAALMKNNDKDSKTSKLIDTNTVMKNVKLPEGVKIEAGTKEIYIYIQKDKFNKKLLEQCVKIVKEYIKKLHKVISSEYGDKAEGFYESVLLRASSLLVESVEGYDDLCQYLNDSLREEKIGTAWYDGNSIKITDINERLTVCDIFFDEDDICVSCDGKGKWFSSEQDKEDIKKYIEKLIHKLDKK